MQTHGFGGLMHLAHTRRPLAALMRPISRTVISIYRRLLRPLPVQDAEALHHHRGPHGARPEWENGHGPAGTLTAAVSRIELAWSTVGSLYIGTHGPWSHTHLPIHQPSTIHDEHHQMTGAGGAVGLPFRRGLRGPGLPLRPALPRLHHAHAHARRPGR